MGYIFKEQVKITCCHQPMDETQCILQQQMMRLLVTDDAAAIQEKDLQIFYHLPT